MSPPLVTLVSGVSLLPTPPALWFQLWMKLEAPLGCVPKLSTVETLRLSLEPTAVCWVSRLPADPARVQVETL